MANNDNISTPDDLYQQNLSTWTKVRDCYEGQRSIINKGRTYLREFYPGMAGDDPEKWDQFLNHTAQFPNATARIHAASTGALLGRSPTISLPDDIRDLFTREFATSTGGIYSFLSDVIVEDLITARTGILVDRDPIGENIPYPKVYSAERILGISTDESRGAPEIIYVRLLEDYPIKDEVLQQVRVLGLDDNGDYYQQLYRNDAQGSANFRIVLEEGVTDEFGAIYPTLNNTRFKTIPFWTANTCTDYCKPVLLDIVEENVHLYNKMSYKNWNYYVQNTVTHFAAGIKEDEAKQFSLGGLWISSDPEAKFGTIGGQSEVLAEGRHEISQSYETIASLGATMFSRQLSQPESGEALLIRNAPDNAILNMNAKALSATLTAVLRFAVEWYTGQANEEVMVEIHNAVNDTKVDPQVLTMLLNGVAQGSVSIETFWYNLEKNNLLPPTFDPAQEASVITNAEPTVV